MKPTALFVYGTLRPGFRLEGWLKDVTIKVESAFVVGYDMWLPEGYWFPIAVRSAEDTILHGDLLWVNDDQRLRETIAMERNAGYQYTRVLTHANGHLHRALMFTYPHIPAKSRLVRSGDWTEIEKVEQALDAM